MMPSLVYRTPNVAMQSSPFWYRVSIDRGVRAVVNVQVLSTVSSAEWAEANEGSMFCEKSLEQLLKLKAAFAKARQLLREMGEVRA